MVLSYCFMRLHSWQVCKKNTCVSCDHPYRQAKITKKIFWWSHLPRQLFTVITIGKLRVHSYLLSLSSPLTHFNLASAYRNTCALFHSKLLPLGHNQGYFSRYQLRHGLLYAIPVVSRFAAGVPATDRLLPELSSLVELHKTQLASVKALRYVHKDWLYPCDLSVETRSCQWIVPVIDKA